MSSTVSGTCPLKIAILGTRGIPANYGGFETFAEELSTRLVCRGHEVTVYSRSHFVDPDVTSYRGARIRVLPAIRTKYLETVSHTILSVLHAITQFYDVVLICNAANAFAAWIPKVAGQKVVMNVDGVERRRKKWSRIGKGYCRLGEFLSTVIPDRAVTDARCIRQYYRDEYGFNSVFIPYGARSDCAESFHEVTRLGLKPGNYVLYVSRLEPENNARLVLQAYLDSGVAFPLVLVGSAPYSEDYIRELHYLAAGKNVLLPGAIYGLAYRELLSHCLCYIHATEVGGTHPALVEAMGVGCLSLVNDTPENREVVAETGLFYRFNDRAALARLMSDVCAHPQAYVGLRAKARERVRRSFNWEDVVSQYEDLFYELVAGPANTA